MIATLPRKVLNTLYCFGTIGGSLDNNLKTALDLGIVGAPQQKFGPTKNSCQRIVEVMRYARGQLAHRRHLLDLRKLFADALLFRDVARKLVDVLPSLFSFFCGRFHILKIRLIGEINDRDDRRYDQSGINADRTDELDGDACD